MKNINASASRPPLLCLAFSLATLLAPAATASSAVLASNARVATHNGAVTLSTGLDTSPATTCRACDDQREGLHPAATPATTSVRLNQLAIAGFTPGSGPAGTLVTITGTDLAAVTGVRFGTGSLTAEFVSQSATSLTVRVPVAAATGVLTLTTSAGATTSSSGSFTYTPRPAGLLAALSPTGPLDVCQPQTLTAAATAPAFNPGGVGFSNASFVSSVAVQADGRVLVGGLFSNYNGSATAPDYLVRLNADGSLDTSFNVAGTSFRSVAVQANGQVLAAGNHNGSAAPRQLVRLNADGSLDASFNAGGTGLNNTVKSIVVQADDRVVVGGYFTNYNNSAAPDYFVRLNRDGSLDRGFNVGGSGFSNSVLSAVVQADGRVVVGGNFTAYNGNATGRLVRLNADGSLDTSFNAGGTGFNDYVNSIVVQADGRVLVGGNFTAYNSSAAGRLVRLNADGSRDATFNGARAGFNNNVSSIALQADGRTLVGGNFTAYNSSAAGRLVRLNADGSLNDAPTAVSGATFTFAPGNTANNPLVTSTAGSYTVVASLNGETSAPSNTVVLAPCPPPTLTSLSPVAELPGQAVVLTGTGFTPGSSVSFGGVAAASVSYISPTALTAIVPVGAAAPWW